MGEKIDVDIVELERFANRLSVFNQELEKLAHSIQGQLDGLGSSWRDEQYAKFNEEWRAAFRGINKFVDETAPEYVRYLRATVRRLRDARRRH